MEILKERIKKDGTVLPGNILKVGSFLNHQLDIELLDLMGKEMAKRFEHENITRILTIEASGIAVACAVAHYFLHKGKPVPVVFAKKNKTTNLSGDCFVSKVTSYTHGKDYEITVEKRFLNQDDNVLLVDDFLANGSALEGLVNLVALSKAHLTGAGIVIEKGFQEGGKALRKQGIRIESLAIIKSMSVENGVVFI